MTRIPQDDGTPVRDAENMLALRNGPLPQLIHDRRYTFYIDASNFERISVESFPDKTVIRHECLGVGTQRNINLVSEDDTSINVEIGSGYGSVLTVLGPPGRTVNNLPKHDEQ